jgi:hypothetical protein
MALKLIPFNASWINHDKIDVHAIYRRPRFVEDKYGEMQREYVDGIPTWDLTGPLPVRQHTKWAAKGFEYVTLADRVSLFVAGRYGTLPAGTTAADFDQHQTSGPWNYRKYAEGQELALHTATDELRADVEEFGSDAVQSIKRRQDPAFTLPTSLEGIAPRATREQAEGKKTGKLAGVEK